MTDFLNKLYQTKKLQFVEPSEEISKSYFLKSESNLESAKILLEQNKLEEAVSLAYFSMYNLVLSLLFKIGIKCENHSGSIILLKELFGLDNSLISEAKSERIDKQYYVGFSINKEEVIEAVKITEEFNGFLNDFTSRMNNSQIEFYRNKLKGVLNEK